MVSSAWPGIRFRRFTMTTSGRSHHRAGPGARVFLHSRLSSLTASPVLGKTARFMLPPPVACYTPWGRMGKPNGRTAQESITARPPSGLGSDLFRGPVGHFYAVGADGAPVGSIPQAMTAGFSARPGHAGRLSFGSWNNGCCVEPAARCVGRAKLTILRPGRGRGRQHLSRHPGFLVSKFLGRA